MKPGAETGRRGSLPQFHRTWKAAFLLLFVALALSARSGSQQVHRVPRLLKVVATEKAFGFGDAYRPLTMEWVVTSAPAAANWADRIRQTLPTGVPFNGAGYVVEIKGSSHGAGRRGNTLIVMLPKALGTGPRLFAELAFVWTESVALRSLGKPDHGQLRLLRRVGAGRAPDVPGLTNIQAEQGAKSSDVSVTTRSAAVPGLPPGTVVGQSPSPGRLLGNDGLQLSIGYPEGKARLLRPGAS